MNEKFNTNSLYITRLFAAIGVVFYHYRPLALSKGVSNEIIINLDEGVNYFYFLSGFVMVIAYRKSLLTNGSIDKLSYWPKRIARIYPLYIVALSLCLLYHFAIHSQFTSLWLRLPFELLMVQSWFYNGSINYPGWSVSCEAFFYLLFPFLTPYLCLLPPKRILLVLIGCLTVNLLVQLEGNEMAYVYQHTFVRSLLATQPVFRILVFVSGMLFALLLIKVNIPYVSQYKMILAFVGLLFLILFALYQFQFGSLWLRGGILVPLYGFFVIVLCSMQGWIGKFLSSPFFILLGDSSYGIYILQFPMHLFFTYFIMSTTSMSGFLTYLGTLVLISVLSHQFFERPLRAFLTMRFSKLFHRSTAF